MTLVELRTKTDQELKSKLVDLAKEKFRMRFQIANGGTVNYANIRQVRRLIAQIKTILQERCRSLYA